MPRTYQTFLLTALLTVAALGQSPAQARPPSPYRWEKIHVSRQPPTTIFARLGLSHSTRNGLTRDGRKDVPDPTFPPGMTDIVPYDAEKLFIVRGTLMGRNLFRARVQAADVPTPLLSLHAELVKHTGETEEPFGMTDQEGLRDRKALPISLGDGLGARVYQITTRLNADGTLWVACRIGLPLPPAPSTAETGTAETGTAETGTAETGTADAGAVFVPTQIWTEPLSRRIRLGETVTFEDLASYRQAASRKLGLAQPDTPDDYTLRLTLTPVSATP